MTYLEALARAIRDALAADPSVLLIGPEYFGISPPGRAALADLQRDFGDRIAEIPTSELALAGAAIGAALAGLRPLVGLGTGSFVFHAFPQVVNEAPNIHYMTGGQTAVPVTFYAMAGIRGAGAAQHSHRLQAMLGNVPGLRVFLPATPADAYGLLRWALLASQNPTMFLAHPLLLAAAEDFDPQAPVLPPGRARVCRAGTDVTIIASSVTVPRALAAAALLEREHGVFAAVVDLRTLEPLDRETVLQSVLQTGRAVIADECHRSFGAGAELAALVSEEAFRALKAPVCRVATPDVPIPFSPTLEAELIVTPEKIAAAALRTVRS